MDILEQTTKKYIDARLAYETQKVTPVVIGADEVAYQSFPAQSLNATKHIYNVAIPSLQTGVVRNLLYHVNLNVSVTGSHSGSGNLLAGVNIGTSDSCVEQIIQNESIKIGSKQNSVDRSQCGVELSRLYTPSSLLANYQEASGGQLHDFSTRFTPWLNSSRNVLAQQFDVPQSDQVPVPRTNRIIITSQNTTSATINVDLWFSSKVSPFVESNDQVPAIRMLDNILCGLQFEGDLSRLFSYDPTTPGSLVLNFTQFSFVTSEVWLTFLSPSEYVLRNAAPIDDIYRYAEIQVWVNPMQTVQPQTQMQFSLQQISGSTIPSKFLVFCRPVQDLLTQSGAQQPRFWLPVIDGGVNAKFNNSTVFNAASARQLYDVACRNGLTGMNFSQWNGRNVTLDQSATQTDVASYILGGGMMVFDPALDLHITKTGLTDSTAGSWAWSGNFTFRNQTYTAINAELVVVGITDGWLQSNGMVSAQTGLVSKQETLAVFNLATPGTSTAMMNRPKNGYLGSGFGSFLSSIVAKAGPALNFLNKHKGEIGEAVKYGKEAYGRYKERKGAGYDEEDDEYEGGALLSVGKKDLLNKQSQAKVYMRKNK
jgi:hypothetical protein